MLSGIKSMKAEFCQNSVHVLVGQAGCISTRKQAQCSNIQLISKQKTVILLDSFTIVVSLWRAPTLKNCCGVFISFQITHKVFVGKSLE